MDYQEVKRELQGVEFKFKGYHINTFFYVAVSGADKCILLAEEVESSDLYNYFVEAGTRYTISDLKPTEVYIDHQLIYTKKRGNK